MRVTALLPLVAIPLLAGCMMPRPWRLPAQTSCEQDVGLPPGSTMFMTLRLPDCSKGLLTRYRSEKLRFAAVSGEGPVSIHAEGAWLTELTRRVALDHHRPPVIFIHGYNNTNEEAIQRTELISKALGSRTVIALTWPSYGKKTAYVWDEANAEWALDAASAAVTKILEKYPEAVLVAHSMGSRLALRAVSDLDRHGRLTKVPRLILAAPDVDRDALVAAWGIVGPPLPVTMYVSRRDQALSLSWRTHAYPRAGDFSWWVTGRQPYPVFKYVTPGRLEVVDTTDVDDSMLGHAAFIEVAEGAVDLCRVIEGGPQGRAIAPTDQNYVRLTDKQILDRCRQNVSADWPKINR